MENDDLKLPNKWIIGDQIRMIKISNINLEGNLAKDSVNIISLTLNQNIRLE